MFLYGSLKAHDRTGSFNRLGWTFRTALAENNLYMLVGRSGMSIP